MKIKVGFGPGVGAGMALDGAGFWALVDALEAGGWDSIWLSERVRSNLFDPLAAMAAIAGRTQRLKFGMSVLVVPGRNPVLLAKELATIDVLSAGRLVPAFGLGSDAPSEHEVFGVARGERAGRTDEAVVLMKRLWTEDDVTFDGAYYRTSSLSVGPKPVQLPCPDVWFGGHSEAAARRVGRVGDGWLPSFIAPDEYVARRKLIDETADLNGRAVDPEHYGALVPYLPDSSAGADAVLAAIAARRPGIDPETIIARGPTALRGRLEGFVASGASKFVVVPVVPPPDWLGELETLQSLVVSPLEA